MNERRAVQVGALIVAGALAAYFVWDMSRDHGGASEGARATATTPSIASAIGAASPPTPMPTPTSTTTTAAQLPSTTATPPAPKLDLSSAQSTVETQLRLLRENRYDEFRQTFRADLHISPNEIDACKKRVASVPVRPDWEMSTEAVENGGRVRRVSMFGKGMTTFRESNGAWLADELWCLPIGLP